MNRINDTSWRGIISEKMQDWKTLGDRSMECVELVKKQNNYEKVTQSSSKSPEWFVSWNFEKNNMN